MTTKIATRTRKAATAAETPTRSRRTVPAAQVEEEPDLLAGMEEVETSTPDDDEGFDLLDSLTEDNGTPWMPWEDDEQPAGIQGRVTYVGTVFADEKYGGHEVPLIELQASDGTVWTVRGYSTVLRNQIEKTNPQVGDLWAVKYLGERLTRRGDTAYHNFKAAVRRA